MTSSGGLKNTPLKKQSKKAQRANHALKRADWNGVVPVTRVVPDKTKYDRNRMKRESND